MEMGTLEAIQEAAKEIMEIHKLLPQRYSRSWAEQQVNDLPANSALAKARKDIGEGRFGEAITSLEGLKDLSGEQLDRRDRLLRMAQQGDEVQVENDEQRIIEQLEKGTLSWDFINKTSLSADDKYKWLSRWHTETTRDQPIRTDAKIWDRLDTRIADYHLGKETKEDILHDLQESRFGEKPNVSHSDYMDFKSRLETEVTKLNAQYLKTGKEYIKNEIVTDLGLLMGQDADEMRDYMMAAIALEQAAKKEELEGEAILKRAIEIGNANKKDLIQRMEELKQKREELELQKKARSPIRRSGEPSASERIKGFLRQKGIIK